MRKITALMIAAAMMIATTISAFAATPAQTTSPAAAPATATVTAEQAKAIALANAGLTEQEVTFVKNQLEFDDGVLQYDIEFVKGQVEYEYDINATTGAIMSTDRDLVHRLF